MTEFVRVGDLEISEDMDHQRGWWRAQRVAAVVMGLIIVAALLGVFHDGPLSDASAGGERAGIEVDYERFLRAESPAALKVRILDGEGKTDVAISSGYLDDFEVTDVEPQPDSVAAEPDRLVYTFEQTPPSQVTFRIEPKRLGVHEATLWGPSDRTVELTQIVWP